MVFPATEKATEVEISINTMSSIELIYYPIHGRALLARMLLKLSSVDFKDTKVTSEEFAKLKPTFPLGQVPVLKVDGIMYCQTRAIVDYVAKLSGLPKLSSADELKSEMVMETVNEVFETTIVGAFMAMQVIPESESEKRVETFYKFVKENVVVQLKKMEKILNHINAGDSVIEGKMSVADLAIVNMFILFTDTKTNCEKEFKETVPSAIKIVNKLSQDPKMKDIIAEAKQVPYLPW